MNQQSKTPKTLPTAPATKYDPPKAGSFELQVTENTKGCLIALLIVIVTIIIISIIVVLFGSKKK